MPICIRFIIINKRWIFHNNDQLKQHSTVHMVSRDSSYYTRRNYPSLYVYALQSRMRTRRRWATIAAGKTFNHIIPRPISKQAQNKQYCNNASHYYIRRVRLRVFFTHYSGPRTHSFTLWVNRAPSDYPRRISFNYDPYMVGVFVHAADHRQYGFLYAIYRCVHPLTSSLCSCNTFEINLARYS